MTIQPFQTTSLSKIETAPSRALEVAPICVLIVDSSERSWRRVSAFLQSSGRNFVASWASSFQRALEVARTAQYDLFLCQYDLGDHTALEFVHELRMLERMPPVVVLVDDREALVGEVLLQTGAQDCLSVADLTPSQLCRAVVYAVHRAAVSRNLARLAQFDQLTGLANRNLFSDRLQRAIARAERSREELALFYLDLDEFKPINDSHGHAAGDEVLQVVANRLRGCVRETDTVARLGGDEFAIVAEGAGSSADVEALVQRLIDAVALPIELAISSGGTKSNVRVEVTTSVGIARYSGAVLDVAGLVSHADSAMYGAKQSGRGRFSWYEEQAKEACENDWITEQMLRCAFRERQFQLYYQPQLELSEGSLAGYEALLRWQHPEHGRISPGEFIPLLERMDLIDEVGEWVMETAALQARAWLAAGNPARVSVNLSPRQFERGDLLRRLSRVLDRVGLEPAWFEVEITEGVLLGETSANEATIRGIHNLGVRIAVDDFGTGYSSLSYLKRFPVDVLKIDQSFVRDALADASSAAIVETVLALGKRLHLEVIAEGVETVEQLKFLRQRGCDVVQGFLLGRPMPASALATWHQAHELWCERQGRALLAAAAVPVASLDGLRVLLVDDDALLRRSIARLVRSRGLTVVEAGSLADARRTLRGDCAGFAFVLTDVFLDDGLGLDLVQETRDFAVPPVFVVMTGSSNQDFAIDALRGGAADFLAKPFNRGQLDQALERALRLRRDAEASTPNLALPLTG